MTSAVNAFQLENGTDIANRREQVLSQYKAFKDTLVSRRFELNNILRLQHFYRDADELERWIADRMQRAVDHSWNNSTNLEVFLQKHRALEAEVLANRESLAKLESERGEMIIHQHTAQEAIKVRLADLHHQWDELAMALELRRNKLNHAKQLVTFLASCDEVLYWIKNKEVAVVSTDLGNDLDHVIMLRAKYDEFANELHGFGERVKDVNESANKMINQDQHPEVMAIQTKQKEVNDAWSRINEQAQGRHRALVASTEVHKFKREVEETLSWMQEKELMLYSEDLGTDVASVQKLQRHHDTIERDMAALKEKVEELSQEANRIEEEHGNISLEDERGRMLKKWTEVTKFASHRKNLLEQRYDLQRFLAESQDLLDWFADIEVRMSSNDVTQDVAAAEALLDKHQEHRGEIGAHESTFSNMMSFGRDLINLNHPAAADVVLEESSSSLSLSNEDDCIVNTKPGEIPERISALERSHVRLMQLWEDRQALYDQCLHLALFNRDAEQAETWMTTQEALLLHCDLGDSLDSVQTLMRKHDDVMKSTDAQEEKINSVDEVASRLVERGHYASEEIENRRNQLLKRHAALKEGIRTRQTALNDAYKLYSFQRNAANLCAWVEEKRTIARDHSYKDPSNARGKLQRHGMFEEEVRASEERVHCCLTEARSLVEAEHYATNEIQTEADHVHELWKKLELECKNRGERLLDSCAEQAFNRSVMDLQRWIDDVETALASGDHGKDVTSVNALIKKHQLLEVDVQVHKDRVDGIELQATKFVDADHFNSDAIKQRQEEVTKRYENLQEPIRARRDKLLSSLRGKQLFRDVQDELEWTQDKRPIATATTIGKNVMSVRNLLRKHQIVQSELNTHDVAVKEVMQRCNDLVEEGHYEAHRADGLLDEITKEWNRLRSDAHQREINLNEALEAHKYLSNANDATLWMVEKRSILSSSDVGVDEDSAESLLRKHEALARDVESFAETVEDLHKEAEAAKLQCPWEKDDALRRVVAIHDYREKTPRELSVRKGDVLSLVSAYNKDWWKVESNDRKGFVLSSCIKIIAEADGKSADSSDDDEEVVDGSKPQLTLLSKQVEVENSYADLKQQCVARHAALEHSRRRHALARECAHLQKWMDDRKKMAKMYHLEEEQEGLEEVEKLQKKLDDFQKDLKAREKRVSNLNNELRLLDLDGASSDSSDSDASNEDTVVAKHVKNLNKEWESLHQVVARQADELGSAHQVQRFFRDAEEVRDWLDEKCGALVNNNIGSDLPTVQALQRKHEGLERDLAALGERVHTLDADGSRLTEQHQEQEEAIQTKQTEINQAWNDLVSKAEARKTCLSDSYDLQQFLSNCFELQHWLRHMSEQVSSDDVADSTLGVESLLQLHQEHRADIDARAPSFHSLERQADTLVQAELPSARRVDAATQELSQDREKLEKSWATRRILLEQCMTFLLFLRDCETAETWMQAREAFIASEESGDSLDSVESLIKKHEDFDRAIGLQEAKMTALQSSAQQLLTSDPRHYANEAISEKAEQVQDRWRKLKAALIEKRSRLGETQTLQQFSRDADEADAWVAERLETALDENYKDPANIQSKHQKHQAFEAELDANRERIHAIMSVGRQLIDSNQCGDSEVAVKERIENLQEEWNNLLNKSLEKGSKLKEANQQQNFIIAVKDLELWMSEVETVLASEDVGKDVRSVANLLKKQKLLEADVAAHEDRARDLARHAALLLEKADESDALDRDTVESKRDAIERRFTNIRELAKQRRVKLQESQVTQQLLCDIVDEESWINEKKLLVGSDDTGRDLTGVHNLKKKQKRIEAEISAHESNVDRIMASGETVLSSVTMLRDEIGTRISELEDNWESLKAMSEGRSVQLSQAEAFQRFRADVEDELAWASEQLALLDSNVAPDTLAASQSFSAKHEALESDFTVHRSRISDVEKVGLFLVQQENIHSAGIKTELDRIKERLAKVDAMVTRWRNLLQATSAFLQFNWRADLVESWMGDQETALTLDEHSDDLSVVQALIMKQATFDAGLNAFEQEGITNITALKDQLLEAGHAQSDAITRRHSQLMKRWVNLQDSSNVRKKNLEKSQKRLRGINDLYLLFAKKASAFNSWFENVEEDLSDPVRCHSVMEIQALLKEHNNFRGTLSEAKQELNELFSIDERLEVMNGSVNPYTWFTRHNLEETWSSVLRMVEDREAELQRELGRQEDNDAARQRFALEANGFHEWLTTTRASMVEESGTLESQLEATKLKSKEVKKRKTKLKQVEDLASALEESLILDNAYTEHSALGLAQQWDQLEQLGMRMQHNLEQQIQARNMTGVTEEALKEFSMMFKHFDKDKTGRLEHHEFKSCLRSLGYDLPMVEEGEEDPEFQAILDMVDPNRDGNVSLQEYMGFMISRETENVKSSGEVESAFLALSVDGKPYVTKDELMQNLSREQAEYCINSMPPYYDSHGISVMGAYDYIAFTRQLFNN